MNIRPATVPSSLLPVAFLAAPLLAVIAPLALAPLAAVAGLIAVFAARQETGRWPRPHGVAVWLLAAFLVLSALSVCWAIAQKQAAHKTLDFVILWVPGIWGLFAARHLPDVLKKRLGRSLWAGFIPAILLLLEEAFCNAPLWRTIHGVPADVFVHPERILDKPVAALCLFVWPVVLSLRRPRPRHAEAGLLLFAAAMFLLPMDTAKLALAAAITAYALMGRAPITTRTMFGLATVTCFALAVPTALFLHGDWARQAWWLKLSAAHRFEIWSFSAQHILSHPFIGQGIEAARALTGDGGHWTFLPETGPVFMHPHSAFIQVWLELGALGALLAVSTVCAIIQSMRHLPDAASRMTGAGLFAVVFVMDGLSFSLWQGWWTGGVFLAILGILATSPEQEKLT